MLRDAEGRQGNSSLSDAVTHGKDSVPPTSTYEAKPHPSYSEKAGLEFQSEKARIGGEGDRGHEYKETVLLDVRNAYETSIGHFWCVYVDVAPHGPGKTRRVPSRLCRDARSMII